jgi:hypothetical protein
MEVSMTCEWHETTMRQYAKIAVFLIGILASMPVSASSPYDPITAPCPSGAVDWTNNGDPKVNWNEIHSEMETRACIRDIAGPLGPEHLREWFQRNKFAGAMISTNTGKRISVTAHWETEKKGFLYKDSLWNNITNSFAYGVVISVTWKGDTLVATGIRQLYE